MSKNLAILGAYSDAMARGDREAVFAYWSPDFVSHVTGRVNPSPSDPTFGDTSSNGGRRSAVPFPT